MSATTPNPPNAAPRRTRSTRTSKTDARKGGGGGAAAAAENVSDVRHRPYPDMSSVRRSSKGNQRMMTDKPGPAVSALRHDVDHDSPFSRDMDEGYLGTRVEDSPGHHSDEEEEDLEQSGIPPGSYYPPSAHPPYELPPSPRSRVPEYDESQEPPPQQAPSPPRPSQKTLPPLGSLAQLADAPDSNMARPPYPYSTLIRYAIEGSKSGRLTLAELYGAIEDRFPWFLSCGNGWKNSIRHNLSLNKAFIKVARPITEPGKGSYWCVNRNIADDGISAAETSMNPSLHASLHATTSAIGDGMPYGGKKRGRKKRDAAAGVGEGAVAAANAVAEETAVEGPTPPLMHSQVQIDGNIYNRYDPNASNGEGSRAEGVEGDGTGSGYYPIYPTHNPAAEAFQYQDLYPPPPSTSHEGAYLNPNLAPRRNLNNSPHPSHPLPYSIPQHVQGPEFVDDRPDRSAPRTIYNHTASFNAPGVYNGGGLQSPPPPLGSMGPAVGVGQPFQGYHHGTTLGGVQQQQIPLNYYSRFAMPMSSTPGQQSVVPSSLAAAMTYPAPPSQHQQAMAMSSGSMSVFGDGSSFTQHGAES